MEKRFEIFGKVYDFSRSIPVINGVRITRKSDLAMAAMEFIRLTGVHCFRWPARLVNYANADRSDLSRFLEQIVSQFATGLVDTTCWVNDFGFTRSQVGDRLYKLTIVYNTRKDYRLLTIDELSPCVRSLFASQYKPNQIFIE